MSRKSRKAVRLTHPNPVMQTLLDRMLADHPDQQWWDDIRQCYTALEAIAATAALLEDAIKQVQASVLMADRDRVLARLNAAETALLGGVMTDRELARTSVLKVIEKLREQGHLEMMRPKGLTA